MGSLVQAQQGEPAKKQVFDLLFLLAFFFWVKLRSHIANGNRALLGDCKESEDLQMKNGYTTDRRLKLTPFELRVAIDALNAKRLKQKANGIV